MTRLPLAISTGDPGGVGPEVALRIALELRHEDAIILAGDASALARRAAALSGFEHVCVCVDPAAPIDLPRGVIGAIDGGASWQGEASEHRPTAAGGDAQLRALDAAIDLALARRVRGLVTAPMSKSAVTLAGHDFVGHTEHLARRAGLRDDDVSMLFLGPRLRVGLVSTHLSIASAPGAITRERVLRTVFHLGEAMLRAGVRAPGERLRLTVAGLNPHAGEGGMFGTEELRVIAPALDEARARPPFTDTIELEGPIGAETAFRHAAAGATDAVVAMLHDQATIASKLLDWGAAVNVTWGLPFVRTSVDHGVAYDAAASGRVEAAGMRAAVRLAQLLTR